MNVFACYFRSGYVRLYWQGRPSGISPPFPGGKEKEINKKRRDIGSVLARPFEKKSSSEVIRSRLSSILLFLDP